MGNMSNMAVIIICIPFAFVIAAVLIADLSRRSKRLDDYMFMTLCVLVLCWFASTFVGLSTDNGELAKFLHNVSLIFVGFIPPLLLLFVLDFFRVSLNRVARFIPLIFVVPVINAFVALTSGRHSLLTAQFDFTSLLPVREMTLVWGPWFWVHTAHSYIMALSVIVVMVVQHFRLPRFYRLPSTLLSIGIAITLLGNVVTLLQTLPAALDPTLIGTSLAFIFFNIAIINNNKSKFIRYSFGKVFDYLDLYILVMDDSDCVVRANSPAFDWFSSLGIPLYSLKLNEVMESLMSKGAIQKDSESGKGIDIYFPSAPFAVVANMYVRKISDVNGDIIGSVAIFTDVTQNRTLIDRLEEKAGVDSLTGIANRMAYEGAVERLDAAENLPLSVIMCDINGLKIVNDTLGHQYGDMMLQVVAGILETECPESGFVARIGGDEFIFLLSCTVPGTAEALVENIRTSMSQPRNLPFILSAAFGTATKRSAAENIFDVVALADSRMYEDKMFVKVNSGSKFGPKKNLSVHQ